MTIQILSAKNRAIRKEAVKQMEVVYEDSQPLKPKPIKVETPQEVKVLKKDMEKPLHKVDILKKNESFKSALKQESYDASKLLDRADLDKKQLPQITKLDHGPKITIPLLETEKITNPQYLSYNDRIRQKIKQRAYHYVNDPDFEKGEVYLTFVLLSNGDLKETKVINSKTLANNYLRRVGLKSIEESSPFPPFPKDFNYPELTFNVVISFEVEE